MIGFQSGRLQFTDRTPTRRSSNGTSSDPWNIAGYRVPPVMHVAERWFSSPKCGAPYGGGPDEDIFVTFGLTPRKYFTGLTALLPFAGR